MPYVTFPSLNPFNLLRIYVDSEHFKIRFRERHAQGQSHVSEPHDPYLCFSLPNSFSKCTRFAGLRRLCFRGHWRRESG